jgi:2-dehydropantoate 2-reductase
MRILVVGAGATGGYFGARLAAAGRDVTFLVRAARAAQLARDGLHVVSPHGDVSIPPRTLTAGAIAEPFDVVLFTVKAFAMDAAIDDIAAAVGPETMIVPVLNGMRHIDMLAERFGDHAVLGGLAFISTTIDDAGRIVQLNAPHDLTYGERSGVMTPRITALDAVMQNAGFDAHASTRVVDQMWEKWVTLAALGGITCLMRGTVGDVVAAPGGLDFTAAFLNECTATVVAGGANMEPAVLERTRAMLTTPGSPLTSSMYRDMDGGSDVEADQILGDLLIRAHAFGVPAPLLASAYLNLKVYQGRR